MDKRYADRVALLVAILPLLDTEPRFALKGGTAINLFEHDLPRLSVDIDLTWLPMQDFDTDTAQIAESLATLAARLSAPPLRLRVRESGAADARTINRLIASRGRTQVQIETTPVMRGAVHPVRRMDLRPSVERDFGSAQVQVLDFADLYGGKMAAALSRQHPRDLFDIGLLLDEDRLDTALWRTFLVYLTASIKPAAEMLAPSAPRDFAAVFESQFYGMTQEPVSVEWLLEARQRLLARIRDLLDEPTHAFLLSVEREAPDFDLIGLPHAANMPGVRRKLQNLAQRSSAKRAADYRQLVETLDHIKSEGIA
ncbi:nucleotidyl transferase AbiEii/AbiGii toxin family protein [Thermomonas sp.]|uniref:nucleotidyl transferase AbiEii/AbiGii toxin family protein n=1 Tax=Thermomonas sp. TaxID=1971895 RepID=UPI0025D436DC|nr:nucleotidyl transferase AbiEii/AbiGii toxin family protein [Thermomonas sp.]